MDPVSYLELSFELGQLDPERAEAACLDSGALSVTFSDASDEPVLEPAPGEMRLWRQTRLQALYDARRAEPALIATLANGMVVTIECSHAYGHRSKDPTMDRQIDLIGEQGVAKWKESEGEVALYGKDRTEKGPCGEGKQFGALYRDFVASVRARKVVGSLATLADGCKAMEAVAQGR